MAELTHAEIEAAAEQLYGHFTENRVADWGDLTRASRRRYRLAAIAAFRAARGVRRG